MEKVSEQCISTNALYAKYFKLQVISLWPVLKSQKVTITHLAIEIDSQFTNLVVAIDSAGTMFANFGIIARWLIANQ